MVNSLVQRTAISPFTQFSKEIRLIIYEYVIVVGCARYIELKHQNGRHDLYVRLIAQSDMKRAGERPYDASLFYVCKEMREECLKIFYVQNTFHVAPLNTHSCDTHWLSYKNIRHLALRLDKKDNDYVSGQRGTYYQRLIQHITKLSTNGNLMSFTIIMSADIFEQDIQKRYREVVPSGLDYECSVAMLRRLKLMKLCSQALLKFESRKLKVFSPHYPEAIRVANFHEADRYLDSLHIAFGGELWINDILCRRDGTQLSKLPFPFGCCLFDQIKINENYQTIRIR
jgi:hypothetical protein